MSAPGEISGGLPVSLAELLVGVDLIGELPNELLARAAHGDAERCALKPELLPHLPCIELPQRYDLIAKHERVAVEPRKSVPSGGLPPDRCFTLDELGAQAWLSLGEA